MKKSILTFFYIIIGSCIFVSCKSRYECYCNVNGSDGVWTIFPPFIYQNRLYFIGRDNNNGFNLYYTDGKILTLLDNLPSAPSLEKHEVGGKVFLVGRKEMLVLVGTNKPTKLNFDNPITIYGALKGKLIFSTIDQGSNTGKELWVADGTTSGTAIIKDLYPGSGNGVGSSSTLQIPAIASVYEDILYFAGNDGINGTELWCTNGTDTGTKMVGNIGSIPSKTVSSNLDYIYLDDSTLYLSMTNGLTGMELYKYEIPTGLHNPANLTLNELYNKQSILYPNPNRGCFILQLDGYNFRNGILYLYDIAGKEIHSQSVPRNTKQLPITISNITSGIYKLYIQLDNDVITHTISIE